MRRVPGRAERTWGAPAAVHGNARIVPGTPRGGHLEQGRLLEAAKLLLAKLAATHAKGPKALCSHGRAMDEAKTRKDVAVFPGGRQNHRQDENLRADGNSAAALEFGRDSLKGSQMPHGDRKHIGIGAKAKGGGTGAMTEIPADKLPENMVLSNRDKAQHSKERGLDGKAVQTEQYQDHSANRNSD